MPAAGQAYLAGDKGHRTMTMPIFEFPLLHMMAMCHKLRALMPDKEFIHEHKWNSLRRLLLDVFRSNKTSR